MEKSLQMPVNALKELFCPRLRVVLKHTRISDTFNFHIVYVFAPLSAPEGSGFSADIELYLFITEERE